MIYNDLYKNEIKEFLDNINLEYFKNKSFLISGGTGLIGSYLVDALLFNKEFNIKVILLVRNIESAKERFSYHTQNKNLVIIEQNLLLTIQYNDPVDYVLHLASNADPISYAKHPVDTMLINFIGCKNLLDYTTKFKPIKYFQASSCEIYGTTSEPMTENNLGVVDCLDIRSCYNESKRASETLCLAYNKEHNINVVIGRICRVYGPTMKMEDSKALSQFIKNSLNKKDITLKSKGKQKYSYLYVSDAVLGILILLEKGEDATAYNISEDKNILSLHEIAEYIASLTSTKVIYDLPSEQEKVGFSRVQNSILLIDKIKNLGFEPKVSIRDGIKKTINLLSSFI